MVQTPQPEKRRVLVVDDSAAVRKWIREQLQSTCEILEASDLEQTEAHLREKPIDLLIIEEVGPLGGGRSERARANPDPHDLTRIAVVGEAGEGVGRARGRLDDADEGAVGRRQEEQQDFLLGVDGRGDERALQGRTRSRDRLAGRPFRRADLPSRRKRC